MHVSGWDVFLQSQILQETCIHLSNVTGIYSAISTAVWGTESSFLENDKVSVFSPLFLYFNQTLICVTRP